MKKILFCACTIILCAAPVLYAGNVGKMIGGRIVQEGSVLLPIEGFRTSGGKGIFFGVGGLPTTHPDIQIDGLAPGIVWADNNTTSALQSFLVPYNYGGNGRFIAAFTTSNVTTHTAVDFTVLVNKDGAAEDTGGDNEDYVVLADATAGYYELVTLVPADDFATLAGGDQVTICVWRDNVYNPGGAGGAPTADLELKSMLFVYDPI